MSSKRKPPENTYWRGDTLYGKVTVKGTTHRWSLRTDDPAVAKRRVQEWKREAIAAAHYGDERRRFDAVLEAWAAHIPTQIAPSTVFRYGVSLKLLQPLLEGLFLDQLRKTVVAEIIAKRRADGAGTATIRVNQHGNPASRSASPEKPSTSEAWERTFRAQPAPETRTKADCAYTGKGTGHKRRREP